MVEKGEDPVVCELSGRELAWFTNTTVPTTVRALGRLRKLGLIKVTPHPKDGRRQMRELDPFGFREL